ncbi:MAG: TolC family protein [Bacteroidales bacterium]|nr:TolC family protein [Bacteroidales bacterium]
MKKIFFLLLPFISLTFNNVHAQKAWSLEECIDYALQNNLVVKRQELNVKYNRNNYSQSKFNALPNLNAGVNHGFTDGSGEYVVNNKVYANDVWSGSVYLNSSLNLFNGFQTINDIKQKKYLFLQSQSDLKKQQNDISIAIANGYLTVLFAKELKEVAENKLGVTTLQAERTKKMVEVGNVAQGEFLQIKAQEANDKTSVINAKNDLEIAVLNLTQLLDLDSTAGFDIVVPQYIEVELLSNPETVQDIYDAALNTMPQIKSAEYALKSSEKQLSKSWGMLSPSFSLNGNLGSDYVKNPDLPADSYFKQLDNNTRKSVGLSVNIPIFNQLQIKNAISNSKLQVNDYSLQLDIAKMALYKEVQQAHADAQAAREKYFSSVEAVNYNEEAFKYTSQKMEVGLVNSVDYNIAQNNLISAQSSMLQAKYEYIFKLKILDFYLGKKIVL